jgi:catechol 2,3-dioxygenase-like lactoylglutathione lyase family enzyme
MSDDAAPAITGVHHFSPTVRDIEASAAWYTDVFGMIRVPATFPHHDLEETGYAILLFEPNSGLLIGLHHHDANEGEPFDEKRTGLDHIGFRVATRGDLDRWATKLDGLGIAHTGPRDITGPTPFSTLVFRDPDNIQLELIYSP